MQNSNRNRPAGLARAARNSAIAATTFVSAIIAMVALLAFVVTNWQRIIWAVTLGKNFWGGFTISALGLIAAAWALCTCMQLDEEKHFRAIGWLKVVAVVGFGLSLLVHSSLFWLGIRGGFGTLSLARQIALMGPPGFLVLWLVYQTYAVIAEHS